MRPHTKTTGPIGQKMAAITIEYKSPESHGGSCRPAYPTITPGSIRKAMMASTAQPIGPIHRRTATHAAVAPTAGTSDRRPSLIRPFYWRETRGHGAEIGAEQRRWAAIALLVVGTLTRRSESEKPMRRFSPLGVVVLSLIASSTGCTKSGSGDCGGHQLDGECSGPYTPAERAAILVEEMRLPPFNARPLTEVRCRLAGKSATCDGTRTDGKRVRVRFTVGRHGHLTALCVSPRHPNAPPNIFCAL
jgi:hypothetical protein